VSTLREVKRRKPRRSGKRTIESIVDFFVFLFPLLFFLAILYGMLGWTFYISFSNWQGTAPNYELACTDGQLDPFRWYRLMFGLARFQADVANNLKWLIIGVVPTVVLALFIAYLLEIGSIPGVESYTRTLILYPVAMSFIVTGTIWSWMYQPDRGVFNTVLRAVGLGALEGRYVTNPATATYWLIVIFVWQYLGFSVIILQSSFRTTELTEMTEAAIVDGASRFRVLWQVIVPNIRGGILTLVSLLLISSLKVFDIVYVVTFGGPGFATDVLAFYMLIATYQQHLVALGAGIGMIIFALACIVVVPYTIYAFRRWFE
jgi:raffinose/stachyose/melibiose transport system permease protein